MNKTTETNDICALTADETLVVSGGQVVNPLLILRRAQLPRP
jgi:hypothetical protein